MYFTNAEYVQNWTAYSKYRHFCGKMDNLQKIVAAESAGEQYLSIKQRVKIYKRQFFSNAIVSLDMTKIVQFLQLLNSSNMTYI